MFTKAKRLISGQSGTVLLETLLVIPILAFFFLVVIYMGYQFYVSSTLERATRLAARELSLGRVDDETNGILTSCQVVTDSTPSGAPSAEALACNFVSNIPGSYRVLASDGSNSGFGDEGDDATVRIEVLRNSVIFLPALPGVDASARLSSQTVIRMQDIGEG